jgi:LytR cell envelope-related transcriptional attenuator
VSTPRPPLHEGDSPFGGDPSPPPPLPPPPLGAGEPRPARVSAANRAVVRKRAADPARIEASRRARVGPAPSEQTATAGIAIIVATIVIGAFVFFAGLNHSDPVPTGDQNVTAAGAAEGSRDVAPTTTTPPPPTTPPSTAPTTLVPPAEVKVLVANAVDPKKVIAGPIADRLTQEKYQVVGKVDVSTASDKSFVYYTGNLQVEAQAIAKLLGIAPTSVAVLPATPPATMNSAQVLVLIGKDKA